MGDFLALCPDSVLKCPFFSIHGEGALFAWIGHLYGIGGLVKRYKCGFGSRIIDVRSSRRGGGEHMAAAGCLTAWLAGCGWLAEFAEYAKRRLGTEERCRVRRRRRHAAHRRNAFLSLSLVHCKYFCTNLLEESTNSLSLFNRSNCCFQEFDKS